MSSTEKLLEATLNRLGVRIEKSLLSSVERISEIAKVAPKKLQKEWELFQEEVLTEVDRLENESATEEPSKNREANDNENKDPEIKIKQIRKQVAAMNSLLEDKK